VVRFLVARCAFGGRKRSQDLFRAGISEKVLTPYYPSILWTALHGTQLHFLSSFDDDLAGHAGVELAEVIVGPGGVELERELVVFIQGLGVEE
jgi:hypothetical protein